MTQQTPGDATPIYPTPGAVEAARVALARQGRREMVYGGIWIAFGLLITLFTIGRYGAVIFVALLPIGWGVLQLVNGYRKLTRNS